MFQQLGGWTGLILVIIVLLVFAAPKLPMFAKNLSQSIRIFKDEMKTDDAQQPSTEQQRADINTAQQNQATTPAQPQSPTVQQQVAPQEPYGTNTVAEPVHESRIDPNAPSNGTVPNNGQLPNTNQQ